MREDLTKFRIKDAPLLGVLEDVFMLGCCLFAGLSPVLRVGVLLTAWLQGFRNKTPACVLSEVASPHGNCRGKRAARWILELLPLGLNTGVSSGR